MSPSAADLVMANATMRRRAAAVAQGVALRRLASFDSWYSATAITSLATDLVNTVEASQRQVTALTNAFLMRVLQQMTGRVVAAPAPVDVTTLRVGISHIGAYARLADQHRYLVSVGNAEQKASERGAERMQAMIATDVALAFRAQAQRFMLDRNVTHWRRVIRPELTVDGACRLCPGNTDVHTATTLLAVHPGCVCDIGLVVDDNDPGLAMNTSDLTSITDRLPADRVIVHHHGELGPILADRHQQWRSPADVAAA